MGGEKTSWCMAVQIFYTTLISNYYQCCKLFDYKYFITYLKYSYYRAIKLIYRQLFNKFNDVFGKGIIC